MGDGWELTRFEKGNPCPVCGGHKGLPAGHQRRCYGYLDSTGDYARCTREEHAGTLQINSDGTYSHRMKGPCRCGAEHAPAPAPTVGPAGRMLAGREVRHGVCDAKGVFVANHVRRGSGEAKRVWWEPGLNGTNPADLLYRAETIGQIGPDEPIYLTEGEPAADALTSIGLPAVATVCGAAQTISGPAGRMLAGRHVIAWPDADDQGRAHMERNAAVLRASGCQVSFVEWTAAPPKGDAADYVALGGTAQGVASMVVEATGPERFGFSRFDLASFLAEPPPQYDWLLDGLLEVGELCWLAGRGKVGKSMVALFLVEAVLSDRERFLGREVGDADWALYIDAENREATVRRRVHMVGMDPEVAARIDYRSVRGVDLGSQEGRAGLSMLVDRPGRGLVILDSLVALHRMDENSAVEVRQFADTLRAIFERGDITVVGLAHENRGGNLRGSLDWRNSADRVLELVKDEEGQRELRNGEVRDGPEDVAPATFRFVSEVDGMMQRRLRLETNAPAPVALRSMAEQLADQIILVLRGDPTTSRAKMARQVGFAPDHGTFKRAWILASKVLEGDRATLAPQSGQGSPLAKGPAGGANYAVVGPSGPDQGQRVGPDGPSPSDDGRVDGDEKEQLFEPRGLRGDDLPRADNENEDER